MSTGRRVKNYRDEVAATRKKLLDNQEYWLTCPTCDRPVIRPISVLPYEDWDAVGRFTPTQRQRRCVCGSLVGVRYVEPDDHEAIESYVVRELKR
jgi:hypothetical protein